MLIRITNDILKPLDQWSNRDFLFYFSNRLEAKTGNRLDIPPIAWQGFFGRMKGFRSKLSLSNEQYRLFVDGVFDLLFDNLDYVPAFGAIVSERVYYIVQRMRRSHIVSRETSSEDFEQLRQELMQQKMYFQQHGRLLQEREA